MAMLGWRSDGKPTKGPSRPEVEAEPTGRARLLGQIIGTGQGGVCPAVARDIGPLDDGGG